MAVHMVRSLVVLLGLLASSSLLFAAERRTEMYIAGQAGHAVSSDLSSINGTGSSAGITISDFALKSGLAYGLKIGGYFLCFVNWLGLVFGGLHPNAIIRSALVGGLVVRCDRNSTCWRTRFP